MPYDTSKYEEYQLKRKAKCKKCQYDIIKGSMCRKRGRTILCTPCWDTERKLERNK